MRRATSLHPAGLRGDSAGPRCSACGQRIAGVAGRARQDLRADAPREGEGRGVAGGAVVGEEELGDAGRSAAGADVVPEARRRPIRDAAADDRARRLRRPLQPRAIPGGLPQPIPEPRGAGGAVAPPQVIQATPGRRRARGGRSGTRRRRCWRSPSGRRRRRARRPGTRGPSSPVERGQEVGDAGGAVREVGQQLRRRAVHRPFAAARSRRGRREQRAGVAPRAAARAVSRRGPRARRAASAA